MREWEKRKYKSMKEIKGQGRMEDRRKRTEIERRETVEEMARNRGREE